MNQSDLAISYLLQEDLFSSYFQSGESRLGSHGASPPQPAELTCGRVEPHGFSCYLQSIKVHTNPEEFNPGFMAHLIPRSEWAAPLEVADTLHLVEVPREPICSVSMMRNFRGRYTTNNKYVLGNSAMSRA